jgi:hypothetical protein
MTTIKGTRPWAARTCCWRDGRLVGQPALDLVPFQNLEVVEGEHVARHLAPAGHHLARGVEEPHLHVDELLGLVEVVHGHALHHEEPAGLFVVHVVLADLVQGDVLHLGLAGGLGRGLFGLGLGPQAEQAGLEEVHRPGRDQEQKHGGGDADDQLPLPAPACGLLLPGLASRENPPSRSISPPPLAGTSSPASSSAEAAARSPGIS